MKVKEFIAFEKSGALYRVINASKNGYMCSRDCVIEADRNVIIPRYGECTLCGFAPCSKTIIKLYVKIEE